MKTLLKLLLAALALGVLAAGGGFAYLKLAFPKVGPATDVKVESTPERIERGKYLANHVAVCIDCHSDRDFSLFSGPIVPGTEGKGGFRFDQNFGFPGVFFAKNITPAGIGSWTDGEVLRAITTGVSKSGQAFFAVMPYPSYRFMAEDDVHAIIAYLRTLPSIPGVVPDSKAGSR